MFDFKNNFKDAVTNLVSLILAILTAVQAYFASLEGSTEVQWMMVAVTALGAVSSWFIGKGRTGAVKPPVQ